MSGSRVYSRQGIGTLNLLQDPYTAKGDLLVGASSFFGVGLWTIFPPGPSNSVLSTTAPRTLAWVSTASTLIGNTGDLITFSGPNVEQNLAIGTLGKLLRSTGTLPAWVNPNQILTGTAGDLLYINPNNTIANLIIQNNGYVLTVQGGLPSWQALPTAPLVRNFLSVVAGSLSTTATEFLPVTGYAPAGGIATEGPVKQVSAPGGFIESMHVALITAPGGAATRRFTLRTNGVSTTSTVIISGANTTGFDNTHHPTIAVADLLSIQCTLSLVPPPAATLGATIGLDFRPDTV